MMDYKRKIVGLGPTIWPTGDYEKDMIEVHQFYSQCTPKHPQLGNSGGPINPA
jgi:hypothetical protein